jgi:SAM-dependent methyltransferase
VAAAAAGLPYTERMEKQPDAYAPIARYYALEQAEQNDDLPFFLDLARRTGGPVLDLGGGDGRVAEVLAKAGLEVTLVETSAAMLDLARRRFTQRSARQVRLTQGDMRSFRTEQPHALAVCAAGTFAHLTSTGDQLQALRAIRRSLTPQGVVTLVLQNPYHLVVDPPNGEVVAQWRGVDPATGDTITKLVTNEAMLANQELLVDVAYDVVGASGAVRRFATEFSLRWTYQPELELLLHRAGFGQVVCYGDYDSSPYSDVSPLLIAVAANARRA